MMDSTLKTPALFLIVAFPLKWEVDRDIIPEEGFFEMLDQYIPVLAMPDEQVALYYASKWTALWSMVPLTAQEQASGSVYTEYTVRAESLVTDEDRDQLAIWLTVIERVGEELTKLGGAFGWESMSHPTGRFIFRVLKLPYHVPSPYEKLTSQMEVHLPDHATVPPDVHGSQMKTMEAW